MRVVCARLELAVVDLVIENSTSHSSLWTSDCFLLDFIVVNDRFLPILFNVLSPFLCHVWTDS